MAGKPFASKRASPHPFPKSLRTGRSMAASKKKVVIAAVQATPVFLDRDATVEKACAAITEAGKHGVGLVVFPEPFIPVYPDWVWAVRSGKHQVLAGLYAELGANAVEVPSATTKGWARRCGRTASPTGWRSRSGSTPTPASGSTWATALSWTRWATSSLDRCRRKRRHCTPSSTCRRRAGRSECWT